MNRKGWVLFFDAALSVTLIIYIVGLAYPESFTYAKNYLAALRYWMWQHTHEGWLKEALVVRGKLQE